MSAIELPQKAPHFTASGITCRADRLEAHTYELDLQFEGRSYPMRVLAFSEQHAKDSWLSADLTTRAAALLAAGYGRAL